MAARRNRSNTQPRAVLWDLDGTLLDSAQYHWLAWKHALAQEGKELTYEQFLRAFGQRNDVVIRSYFGPGATAADIERISAGKEEYYRSLIRACGIDLLPGVEDWLKRLKDVGWKQAVASSAPALNISAIVETLKLSSYFDVTVSAEDVGEGKPDPEIFLRAASKIGVPVARCVVVEDAPSGVEAARRAGMHTIGVLSSHQALDADMVVPTLQELPANAFDQLVPEK